jgi:putative sterol carrier protein
MYLYPSVEWVEALADRLNALPAYRDSSENWQGKLALVALAEPGKLKKDFGVIFDPTGGTIRDVREVSDIRNTGADYTLTARYSVWKGVIRDGKDILWSVMTGKIKLKGNVFKLMLQLKTPEIMMREMRALPTKFVDD